MHNNTDWERVQLVPGSDGGVVFNHFRSKGPGFEPRCRHYDFRDLVSPAFKSQYNWNIVKM